MLSLFKSKKRMITSTNFIISNKLKLYGGLYTKEYTEKLYVRRQENYYIIHREFIYPNNIVFPRIRSISVLEDTEDILVSLNTEQIGPIPKRDKLLEKFLKELTDKSGKICCLTLTKDSTITSKKYIGSFRD